MSKEPLCVLSIEDDLGEAELLHRQLDCIDGYQVEFLHAQKFDEARQVLKKAPVDVIFMDYFLGADTGDKHLEALRTAGDARSVIALSGRGDEYIARDLLSKGADDYIPKRDMSPDLLRRSIESATSRYHRRRLETLNKELARDLQSKNKALEQKNRRLAELFETAHEFVDNVSHEFRTPLTVIKEFTAILHDGLVGELTPEQKKYLETVLDRVDELATLIDDMLDISKLEAGLLGVARRICTVDEIIGRVRKTLERKAATSRVNLIDFSSKTLPLIYCDPEKISRVIINLTVNAIKFSEEGNSVTISATDETEQGVIRISVTDHGPGIEPEKVAELFERFRQLDGDCRSSTKGFGLGLNIARELVLHNFGDIDVKSHVGEGSTFSFTVPIANSATLIPRYLDRLESLRTGATFVSIIAAKVDDATTPPMRADMERFIQHQIRKSDIILPGKDGTWIVVAASNQPELSAMIQRLERAHSTANRNRPGSLLPTITLNVKGTWSIAHQLDRFINAAQRELAPMELPP